MHLLRREGGVVSTGAHKERLVERYGEANDYTLPRVKAATVHELHHKLAGAVGMGGSTDIMTTSVGEYMIGEGLAESFAAELYGEDKIGFWVTDFDSSRLEKTKRVIFDGLEKNRL